MHQGALTAGQRRLAVGLVLAVTLVAFEVTSVATALPTISADLRGDGWYGLALSTYTLANMAGLVIAGQASDRFGPARPFLVGTAVFVAGLVVAASAPSMAVVVLGRTLQGAGTGGYAPIAYVLVKRAFPTPRQPMVLALLSAGWVLPSLLAPFAAGLITDHIGWRWVFWLIVPAAVLVGVLNVGPMGRFGPVGDPGDRDGPSDAPGRRSTIGAALIAATGVGAVVGALQMTNLAAALLVGAAGLALALPTLGRLLPPGTARAATGLPAVLACRILATAAFGAVDGLLPLAAGRLHGASPTIQGTVIIGAALSWTVAQWWSARRAARLARWQIPAGFAILAVGAAAVAPVVRPAWPLWAVFAGWVLGGVGMGLLFNPTSVAGISYATAGEEGRVGGQISLADSIGFSVLGGVSGGLVSIADHTALSLGTALLSSFALAAAIAMAGATIGRRVRSRPAAPGAG